MNEMKIRISLYFEIKDSEMFGGEGSVGYTEQADLTKYYFKCGKIQ